MRYTVTKTATGYEIMEESGRSLGMLNIGFWTPGKATFAIPTAGYHIFSKDFWQSKKIVTRNDIPFAEIRPRAWRGLDINFEHRVKLSFGNKSIWRSGEYILTDDNGTIYATVHAHFTWRILGFTYHIDIHENMIDAELKMALPFLLMYCVLYVRRRRTAAAAS